MNTSSASAMWSQATTQQETQQPLNLTFAEAGGGGSAATSSGGGSSSSGGGVVYTISGIKVEFPTKAYPSQIAMMNTIIQSLKQNKNCLLESPTGSGKTLALLCAALAWQRNEYDGVAKCNEELDAKMFQEAMKQKQQNQQLRKAQNQNEAPSPALNPEIRPVSGCCASVEEIGFLPGDSGFCSSENVKSATFELTDDEDEDGDFKPKKRLKSFGLNLFTAPEPLVLGRPSGDSSSRLPTASNPNANVKDEPYFVPAEKRLAVPKIYFGTRTHKQISQITRELRKTVYGNTRTVILASREHTCINPLLSQVPNKNERCKELLDSVRGGEGCMYFAGARKFGNFGSLQSYGVGTVYDLEDLVRAGKSAKSCPYYATRYLMDKAEIIFCPYNYIIDPTIRNSLNLDLEGQVVILDEAHNMEDASREAASFSIKQHEVSRAMQDCERVKNTGGAEPHALGEIVKFLSMFCNWIDSQTSGMQDSSFNTSGRHWTGTDLIASLMAFDLDNSKIARMEICFKAVMADREREMELTKEKGIQYGSEKPAVNAADIAVIESVIRLFQEMYKDGGRNRDDFRIALIKSIEKRRTDGRIGVYQSLPTLTLNIWCLNPAVAFSEIREAVQTIVLTSGTLSPMKSFQSELGTPFPLKLEASHVIDRNQVWAGVLGAGPTGQSLNGAYQNTETLAYQDAVGSVVRYVCRTMPYGVLCFFPSYRMLETMYNRWQNTSILDDITAKKQVILEPRTGNADFTEAMEEFYAAIRNQSVTDMDGQNGALFLAVCRGKVSEGLDFSNNNARAVICIGIPFPNFRDLQVELKRKYNQENMKRGLLSGSEWYEIQAFRALNQALGHCIRHRHDWGAILLIDDRYIKYPRYIQSLSKWIRFSNFEKFDDHFQDSLECFRDQILARPPPPETQFEQLAESIEKSLSERSHSGGENVTKIGMKFNDIIEGRIRQPLSPHVEEVPNRHNRSDWGDAGSSDVDADEEFTPNMRAAAKKKLAQERLATAKPSGNRSKKNSNPTNTPPVTALFARQSEGKSNNKRQRKINM